MRCQRQPTWSVLSSDSTVNFKALLQTDLVHQLELGLAADNLGFSDHLRESQDTGRAIKTYSEVFRGCE